MSIDWIAAIRQEAEALAGALRSGAVPRARRALARALLAEAFAACEDGRGDASLLRRLDAVAHPFAPRIPRPVRVPRLLRGAIDRELLERLEGLAGPADRLVARVDRFLAVTGIEGLPPTLKAPKPGDPPPFDMDLTKG
jgi:hypothetical protein